MARHRRPEQSDELPPAPLNAQTLREAWHLASYLWPYRVRFALAMGCLFLGSLVGLGFPYLAGNLVDGALLTLRGEEATTWYQNVDQIALALMVVLALQASFAYLREIWFAEVGERSLADLRRDTFARIIALPLAFHATRRVGELGSRISADLSQIHDSLIEGIPHFLRQAVLLAGGVVLILITSLRLTIVMLASVPVLMVVAVLFGRLIHRLAKEAQDRLADSNVVVEESLQNIATVKAFTAETHERDRYRAELDRYITTALRGARLGGAFVSFIVFALFGSIVLVLWYGARLVLAEQLSAGELTRFMLLTLYVSGAIGSFAALFAQLQRTLGCTQRVRELLRETTEPIGGETPHRLRGDVELSEVVFRYPSRSEVTVLDGVSLSVKAGQRVALVGHSGAGKSTLVSLLLRFHEPTSGVVYFDGHDAKTYDLQKLRQQTALVPQDVILFGGTIAENIAYGKQSASQEEIEQAARLANAHDFILSFPEGYATRVGERGVQLSGGQRQRVAIARALLRDPAILLLDEATSSLDSESESLVLQALDRLMQGRTSIVIAHRLSTVRNADRIFVLRDGKIVEAGSHDELLARPEGVYRTLTQMQLDGPADEPVLTEGKA